MHARLTRITQAPERLEETISSFQESVVAPVQQQPGYAGVGLAVNREDGAAIAFTLWATEEAMQASENLAQSLRTQVASEQGAEIVEVERYEVAHMEGAFKAGTFSRVTSGRTAPERIPELEGSVHQQALPLLRSQSGFLRASIYVDRRSGSFVLVSGWETPEDREASDAAIASFRQEMVQALDASPVRVEPYELVVSHVTAGTGIRT
jgi:heme-degrading monooxygenase HmoA